MKKIILFFIGLTVLFNSKIFAMPREMQSPYYFEKELQENKDNREKQEEIYLDYIYYLFEFREFDKSVEKINKFEAEFGGSKYADDVEWFKGYIYRYFSHKYPELMDGYLNLTEKYDGVKTDYKNFKNISLPKNILETEQKEAKELLAKLDELKEKTKSVQDEKTLKIYFEIGKIYRENFNDLESAEEWYLKGTKADIDNEETAKLFFELGEMYRGVGLKKLPVNFEAKNYDVRVFSKKYDYWNDNYKQALEYYLKVYEKYPKNKLAPKALEQAANLYETIGWRFATYDELLAHFKGQLPIEDMLPGLASPDYSKASEIYEKIIKEYPDYENLADVLVKLGEVYYRYERQFEKAKTIYRDLIKKYPETKYEEEGRSKIGDIEYEQKREELKAPKSKISKREGILPFSKETNLPQTPVSDGAQPFLRAMSGGQVHITWHDPETNAPGFYEIQFAKTPDEFNDSSILIIREGVEGDIVAENIITANYHGFGVDGKGIKDETKHYLIHTVTYQDSSDTTNILFSCEENVKKSLSGSPNTFYYRIRSRNEDNGSVKVSDWFPNSNGEKVTVNTLPRDGSPLYFYNVDQTNSNSSSFNFLPLNYDTGKINPVSIESVFLVKENMNSDVFSYDKNDLEGDLLSDTAIFHQVQDIFGKMSKDVDGDGRISIVRFPIAKNAGYFSNINTMLPSDNESISRISNFREMLALDLNTNDSVQLKGALAHEFQHLIHNCYDKDEEQWVTEGCSMLAMDICGYSGVFDRGIENFSSKHGDEGLFPWDERTEDRYGISGLWFMFLQEKFSQGAIKEFVADTANGIDVFRKDGPFKDTNFDELFQEWLVLNYVNNNPDFDTAKEAVDTAVYKYDMANDRRFDSFYVQPKVMNPPEILTGDNLKFETAVINGARGNYLQWNLDEVKEKGDYVFTVWLRSEDFSKSNIEKIYYIVENIKDEKRDEKRFVVVDKKANYAKIKVEKFGKDWDRVTLIIANPETGQKKYEYSVFLMEMPRELKPGEIQVITEEIMYDGLNGREPRVKYKVRAKGADVNNLLNKLSEIGGIHDKIVADRIDKKIDFEGEDTHFVTMLDAIFRKIRPKIYRINRVGPEWDKNKNLISTGYFEIVQLPDAEIQQRRKESEKANTEGETLMKQGRYREALDAFGKAVDPDHIAPTINEGKIYLIKRVYDNAIGNFNCVLAIDSTNSDAYFGLSEAYEKTGEIDKALESMGKYISYSKDEDKVKDIKKRMAYLEDKPVKEYYNFIKKGDEYKDKQEMEKAKPEYENAIKAKPEIIFGYLKLANIYEKESNFSKAGEIYRKAIEKHGEDYELYLHAANISSNYQETIELMKKAIKVCPIKETIKGINEMIEMIAEMKKNGK